MRLRTFGGLWIEAAEPSPSLGPRQLALLVLVAAAGRKGISRDRLIGLLWSENEEELARHSLSQTLYSLRRETGSELVQGTTQLRLAPVVTSDVAELDEAIAKGAPDAAAVLYTGRFLDGFYLPGAPEFERWVEEERARLHRAALDAIERLATQASTANLHAEAVRLWQRLAHLDPLSARYAAGCMRALAAAGDRPHALAQARLYKEAVRRELDAEPDPAVRQLEQWLRTTIADPALSAPPPAQEPTAHTPPAEPPPARRRPSFPLWAASVAILLVIVAGLAVRSFGSRSASARPFLAVGDMRTLGSPDSAASASILRDMLSTSLGGLEGLQVVANSRLVELMPARGSSSPGVTADAARRAGATEIIEGELSTEPGGLLLSLRRVALSSGMVRKGYLIRATDRYAIVDSATAAIARDLRLLPPSVTVAQIRTSSPGAYALYEEGLRANYGWDGAAAYRLMSAALGRDSSFAMAAYYVWQLGRNIADDSTSTAARERARLLASRTIERERLLILGSIAEVEAPVAQAVAIAETLTVKYPSDPEGHILLGTVRFRQGNWPGSLSAYQQAFALDSAAGVLSGPYCRLCEALGGIVQQYLWWDSAGAAERTARKLIALRPKDLHGTSALVEPLFRQGRRREAEAAQLKLTDGSAPNFGTYRDDLRWGRYEEADGPLREISASPNVDVRTEAWWLLILSMRDQGRLRSADSVVRRWHAANIARGYDPASQRGDLAMVALEMGKPQVTIRAFRIDAERTARSTMAAGVRNRYLIWYLTLAGTAYAAAGDTSVVRRLADSLEILGPTSQFGRDAKLHFFLRGLLFQQQGRHAEAVDAFQRSLFSLTDGFTRTNLMLARSLLELHRPTEAIAVLRPAIHGGLDGSNTYVSRTELHEALAQAFDQAGQRDSALVHWRAVESAWRLADPQFRDRYEHARARAAGMN